MRRFSTRGLPGGVAGLLLGAAMFIAGCGGGGGVDGANTVPAAVATPASGNDGVLSSPQVRQNATALAATAAFNGGWPDPGLLMLLVPDTVAANDVRISSWVDAASEVGARIAPITDAQFLALGSSAARGYAGLVLPDQLHTVATDALIAAVRAYTQAGGRTMLCFDFGALTLNSAGAPVYPIPQSRLSDLAGVNYVQYDALRDRTVGLGPVTATNSTLRELLVPPGKSLPYLSTVSVAAAGSPSVSADVPATRQLAQATGNSNRSPGVLDQAGLGSGEALYLPVSPSDPGGVKGFDAQQYSAVPYATSNRSRVLPPTSKAGGVTVRFGNAKKGPQIGSPTLASPVPTTANQLPVDSAAPVAPAQLAAPRINQLAAVPPDRLEAVSGYLFGALAYPSYVTTGTYTGTTLAASPQFGLIAGIKPFGSGKVMFVNLPVTYLKFATDAMLMHGFLHYFNQYLAQGPRLSAMPNAVAGMTLDWHLDSNAAQAPTLALEAAGVFNTKAFSIDMTAGPDDIAIGDGLGWNLDNNLVAQAFLKRMDLLGHAVASHGGWDHDYYGINASETNASTFLQYLVLNKASIDRVIGRPMRSYSAPEGNNPTWAMTWLEQQGVVGTYFGGHTGLGATRQYRNDALLNPKIWVSPVTPQGLYATFEEFQDFNVPKQDVIDWYHALVDFNVAHNASRLVYLHPPGASLWPDVVQDLLSYSASKGAAFRWYTMPRLADFMTARQQATWSSYIWPNGHTVFSVSHPKSLAEMVWMLPKARYLKPTINVAGTATVADGGSYWLVKANAVRLAYFDAAPNPTFVP